MFKFKNPWTVPFLMLGLLIVVGVGARLAFPPRPPVARCASTADCPTGHRCVTPGVCGPPCKADGDCPTGRRCLERPLAHPEAEPGASAGSIATCLPPG
jgi:Cys-rich repeat protein